MKKKIALLLGLVLTVSSLAVGCGNAKDENKAPENKTEDNKTEDNKTEDNNTVAEGGLRTGLAVSTNVSGSKEAAADAEGEAKADMTIAAVTVDSEGKIVECIIDGIQGTVKFDAAGKVTSDLAEVKTKNELGADYGMVAFGGAVAEWNEQAAAFAAYCVGKTADEVTGMEITEDGKAADADLAATCTINVQGFQAVVAQAVANATDLGAKAGDKLGFGAITSVANSADAGEKDGVAEVNTTISVLTVNGEGKISSAVIDGVQAKVSFDAAGKITSDLAAAVKTKNELGADYGMVAYGGAKAEWNEQAAAYAAYAVGKTADEVNATAVTEGVPSDADLAASVTIHIADFNNVITKAFNSAK